MYTNKEIWNVSYPIFLGLLAQNIINVTDTAFLGRVGEVELGASAMGGLFYICVFTIAFGFSVGSQILIARRNGEGRYKDVGPVMIQGGIFLLGLAVLMFGLTHLLAPSIVRLLISSDSIFDATMEFLNWRIWGFFFAFVNVMFRALYIGITRTKVLTMNAVVMALVNVLLDYILIFGKFGMPEMGIKGAAVASVMAEAASLAFFLIYTYAKVDFKKFGLNHWQKIDFSLLGKILSISCFTMIQYFLAMATWFVFFIAIERLGQRELAIANIVRSIYIVMLIPVQALSTTTNSLVSNLIGAGGITHVMRLIWRIARMSFLIMVVCVAVVVLFPHAMLSVYTNEPALLVESVPSLYVIAGAMIIASVANIYFNAISGTGNTQAALILEMGTLVFYALYILWIGMVVKAPVSVCFSIEVVYYSLLLLSSIIYLKKAKWQNKKIYTAMSAAMGIDADKLKEAGVMYVGAVPMPAYMTMTGKLQFYQENPGPIENYGQPMDPASIALPHWEPPMEAWPVTAGGFDANPLAEKYPLIVTAGTRRFRVHSYYGQNPLLREMEINEPCVRINPVDAEARGIEEGSYVRLFNDRGHAVAKATFSAGIRPGCLDIDRGWQRSQYLSGCNNDLTSKQIVDWTCPTYAYHDCLVEIEPWDGVVAESQE